MKLINYKPIKMMGHMLNILVKPKWRHLNAELINQIRHVHENMDNELRKKYDEEI